MLSLLPRLSAPLEALFCTSCNLARSTSHSQASGRAAKHNDLDAEGYRFEPFLSCNRRRWCTVFSMSR